MKGKKKTKKIKPRNYIAVHAHRRTSAGPIKDKKKEESKSICRDKDSLYEDDDLEYDDTEIGDE